MWQQRRSPANHRNILYNTIFFSLNWTIENKDKDKENLWRLLKNSWNDESANHCNILHCGTFACPLLKVSPGEGDFVISCCEEVFFSHQIRRSWHWCDYKETQIKFIWKCWLYDVITNGRFFGQTGWQRRRLQQFPSNTAGGKTIKIYRFRIFMLCLTFLNVNNILCVFTCLACNVIMTGSSLERRASASLSPWRW